MIDELDASIAALLRKELPQSLVGLIDISFAAPDGQFPPPAVTLPAVDFFLYDIRENLDLRSTDVYVERRDDGSARKFPAPVRIDFSYLITAWPSPNVQKPAEDEHKLLGAVMRVLLRYRTMPADFLIGDLKDQVPSPPIASLQPGRLQGIGELWQALGGKPKATLNYTVTLAVAVNDPIDVPIVKENIVRLKFEVEQLPITS